jgi:hypothetical protein
MAGSRLRAGVIDDPRLLIGELGTSSRGTPDAAKKVPSYGTGAGADCGRADQRLRQGSKSSIDAPSHSHRSDRTRASANVRIASM